MKIILKNTSMEFKTYSPKLSWTDSELKSASGYLPNAHLTMNEGNVKKSPSIELSVSPVIDLANAKQIVINAWNKRYNSSIAFFNSSVSTDNAVYHIIGTSAGDVTETVTIDSETIQAAVALGADSFRITMNPNNDSSVVITQ